MPKSNKVSRKRSRKQSGGGSDWMSTVYSRGPVNAPSHPDVFAEFAEPSKYVSNEALAKGSGADLSVANVVPQNGGNRKRKSRKTKSLKKSEKSKITRKTRKSKKSKKTSKK